MKQDPIIICGGGIVGLACAAGLAKAGLKVAILGPRHKPLALQADQYHPRVYAISSSSQALLKRLGAWALIDEARITAVDSMEVYGDADGMLDLSAWQDAQLNLAWIVESGEIERALQQVIKVLDINWHEDQFTSYESQDDGVSITTATGKTIAASLLIGADGAKSPVRQAAQIKHDYTPYGDMGVVAHLNIDLPHQNRAYQWFTGDSILALLPMPDTADGNQASLVWSMYETDAQQWIAMNPDQQQDYFSKHVRAITGGRLGNVTLRSKPQGFPLTLERTAMVAPGVALVGDAAHRVHPLAGQGLNLGLGDVQDLIHVLTDTSNYSHADMRILSRYRRHRAEPVLAMALVTDGLHKLFAAQSTPLAWARNVGMRIVNDVPFIKRHLIRSAS